MTAEQQLERSVLERKEREELRAIAQAMSLDTNSRSKKADIIDQILRAAGCGGVGRKHQRWCRRARAPTRHPQCRVQRRTPRTSSSTVMPATGQALVARAPTAVRDLLRGLPALPQVDPRWTPPLVPRTPMRSRTSPPVTTAQENPTAQGRRWRPRLLVPPVARGRTRIASTCHKADKVGTPTSPGIAVAGVAVAASAPRVADLVVAVSVSCKEAGKKPSTPVS